MFDKKDDKYRGHFEKPVIPVAVSPLLEIDVRSYKLMK